MNKKFKLKDGGAYVSTFRAEPSGNSYNVFRNKAFEPMEEDVEFFKKHEAFVECSEDTSLIKKLKLKK